MLAYLLLPLIGMATPDDQNICSCDYTPQAYELCVHPSDGSPGDGDGCGEGLLDFGDEFKSKKDCVRHFRFNKECETKSILFSRSESNQKLRDGCNFRLCMSDAKITPECEQDGIGCVKWERETRKACTTQMKANGCVIGSNKKWQVKPATSKAKAVR